MPREPDWRWEMEMALSGRGDWFSCHLLRLISKADMVNRLKIKEVYPDHVAAFERYLRSEDEFSGIENLD